MTELLTEGGAFDVQALCDLLESSDDVAEASAAPTGMRNDGPPEFHVTLEDGSSLTFAASHEP